MSNFYLFKNAGNLLQQSWLGMLLISIGLHSLLLIFPTTPKPTLVKTELEKIRIIELPSMTKIASYPKSSAQNNSSTQSLVKKNVPILNPVLSKQEITKQIKQDQVATKPTLDSSTPQPATQDKVTETKAPFTDFPQYPNAERGSFGLLQGEENLASQQTGDRPSLVAAYFERELPIRGYEVKIHSSNQTQKVYQVSKGGLTQYLNLISSSNQGTAIALSSKPIDINNLQVEVASKSETEFNIVLKRLNELGAQRIAIPEFYFVQPELFYAKSTKERDSYDIDKPRAGFDGNFVVILDKKPEEVFNNFFALNLQNSKFEISQAPNYGGGLVYQIKQSSFTRYLNLLPTKSGGGTIVVVWKNIPKQDF
jgi:hypothetical protein